jgi:hypothetical protein
MTTDYLKDAEAAMGLAIERFNHEVPPWVHPEHRAEAAARREGFEHGLHEGRRIIQVAVARRDTAMAKYAELGLWEHLETLILEAIDEGKDSFIMARDLVALEKPVIEEALQAAVLAGRKTVTDLQAEARASMLRAYLNKPNEGPQEVVDARARHRVADSGQGREDG